VTAQGILLDIEGTTTPITFVYEVLFPFARQHAAQFLRNADVRDLKREYEEDVLRQNNPPPWTMHGEAYFYWLMDQAENPPRSKRFRVKSGCRGTSVASFTAKSFPMCTPP